MQHIWTICKREINAFFDSLMAYIMLVVFLGISGLFTWLFGGNDIFFVGQASLGSFFGVAFWTLFFFIPAVTMRMVAEEERAGTLELLATKPLSHFQIVAGKWLAAWLLIAVSLALTLPYYLTVASLGPIDHGATVSGYLALLFVSAVYTSIGIFASSLTSNQIVAFIGSLFIAIFFHLLFGQMTTILPEFMADVVEFMSLNQHYQTMARGVIGISNIVYLVSLTLLGFLFASVSLKRRAWK
ncbi:MAG: ABC transporter permease subunit [Balneolaceae bacterium]|nr:ABC transporter permease subunit [Balneolaceae bacterium]